MELIEAAAEAIRQGQLVVMPTETVYGLAADATNADAVGRIFAVKGRPADNPLIVHVDSIEMALSCVSEWPEMAEKLAGAFWPGPLSLVLPKSPKIPSVVSAGLDTVGIRMPDHPIALALIRHSGLPLAAPSANPANAISPTRVSHLAEQIISGTAVILDAGPCEKGIESTVVTMVEGGVIILRPGAISREDLARIVPVLDQALAGPASSPGLSPRHYSPRARVELTDHLLPEDCGLTFCAAGARQISMPNDPTAYAHVLYDALHRLDGMSPSVIRIEAPPQTPEWEAVWDRLRRAANASPRSGRGGE